MREHAPGEDGDLFRNGHAQTRREQDNEQPGVRELLDERGDQDSLVRTNSCPAYWTSVYFSPVELRMRCVEPSPRKELSPWR